MRDMEQMYRKYMPQVYKFLFSLCRDAHLAEELTQKTFFQALKSIDSFRGDCKLYVWLCSIAKHLWMKELKRQNKEKPADIPEGAEIHIVKRTERDGNSNPESSAIQKDEVMELYKLLHSLDEPVREVMYLRLNGDFSFREIGEIMGRVSGILPGNEWKNH